MTITTRGPQPTGKETAIGVDDLFFSTTDRRGVIRSGNSVFVRISGYSLDELTGAPHNLIRHPGMPGGAFKAMWDRLLAGQPMASYVKNLAKDGSAYWVFATVTPLGDGFLSVRMAPMTPLQPTARQAYQQLLAAEREARAEGLSRAQAAARGAVELDRAMRLAGFSDYEHFMTEALPAEVAARAGALGARFAERPGQGPAGEILGAASALDEDLGLHVGRLDTYRELSAALSDASQSMLSAAMQLETAAAAAREASARAVGNAPVLHNVAEAMVTPSRETVGSLRALVDDLGSLRDLIAGLRFRIALARLHTGMVSAFASEVIDGVAPPQSLSQVPLLAHAVREGGQHLAAWMETVNSKLGSVADEVGRAGKLFNDFRRFMGKWRLLVVRHQASAETAGYVAPIDQMLANGHGQLSALHTLAMRCREEVFPFNGAALDGQLARIQHAAGQF